MAITKPRWLVGWWRARKAGPSRTERIEAGRLIAIEELNGHLESIELALARGADRAEIERDIRSLYFDIKHTRDPDLMARYRKLNPHYQGRVRSPNPP